MQRLRCALCRGFVIICLMVLAPRARADFLFYAIPGTAHGFFLEGRVEVSRDYVVSYYNATLKKTMNFKYADVRVLDVPTAAEKYTREIASAKDADAAYEAAVRVMKRGVILKFYEGVDKALTFDKNHPHALKVKALKKEIEKELPGDYSKQETELRAVVKKEGMKIATSKHFILLHDTPDKIPAPDKSGGSRRKKRSEIRLELLEQVYEAFLMLFVAQDVTLDVPQERMKVVLFNDKDDYDACSKQISRDLTSASGFWSPTLNISFFYDHSTTEEFTALKKELGELQGSTGQAKRARLAGAIEAHKFINTLTLLVQIAEENADIKVVSHEATHQMAGNTGLFPRFVHIPAWAHEGLATYFESPGERGWSGIGAVNEERIKWYRALENDDEHSNIDFIVGDQIFKYANSLGDTLHGYGQAWALTHFLMEKHLGQTVEFYRRLGEMPPQVILNPALLTTLFDQVFGTNRAELDAEWRAYMRSLKTDLERATEEAAEKAAKKRK